jgi:predicted nuclease of predicted toxin-antitoxin system
VNFLIDAQLPPALARWIGSQGHQATHVFEVGLQAAEDDPIWEHARKREAVIVKQGEQLIELRA